MEHQNTDTKVITFESATLFKKLVEGNQLKNLKGVKSSSHIPPTVLMQLKML